jgi:hypothetical protein
MWSWTPEAAELLGAIAFAIGARIIDAKPWRHHPVPAPKPPKYDDHAHAERVRKLLSKRLETLPLEALLTLLEAATLLEAGEPLDTLVARPEARDDRAEGAAASRRDGDDAIGVGHDPAAQARTRRGSRLGLRRRWTLYRGCATSWKSKEDATVLAEFCFTPRSRLASRLNDHYWRIGNAEADVSPSQAMICFAACFALSPSSEKH